MSLIAEIECEGKSFAKEFWQRLITPRQGGRLWTWMVASLLALAWLQPHHYHPIPGFHKEAWMSCWFGLALLALAFRTHERVCWSLLSWVFISLSAFIWVQYIAGMQSSGGQVLMISAMLMGCALVIEEVRSIQVKDPTLVLDILMMAIAIGSVVSVFLLLVQLLQIQMGRSFEWILWISSPPDGVRPAANMGQPNQMATILSFALVAGLWAKHRGLWSHSVLSVYLILIAIGLGIVQSRTGLIQGVWLCFAAFIWSKALRNRVFWKLLALALLVQVGVFSMVNEITAAILDNSLGRDLSGLNQDATRLSIYQLALDGILGRPWLGWGIQELHSMQWHLSASSHALGIYIASAHNLVLDIVLWLGIPLAVVVISIWCYVFLQIIQRVSTLSGVVSLMCVGSFMIHAMVEMPHWIPSLLLPAVAILGVLLAETMPSVARTSGYTLRIFLATILFTISSLAWLDYIALEENFRQLRAEQNRLIRTPVEPHQTWVMHHLADNLRMSRMIGRIGTNNSDLAWMDDVVRTGPTYGVLFTHITSLALAGRVDDAQTWMRRLDVVAPAEVREGARVTWKRYQTWYPRQLAKLSWPTEPAHFSAKAVN